MAWAGRGLLLSLLASRETTDTTGPGVGRGHGGGTTAERVDDDRRICCGRAVTRHGGPPLAFRESTPPTIKIVMDATGPGVGRGHGGGTTAERVDDDRRICCGRAVTQHGGPAFRESTPPTIKTVMESTGTSVREIDETLCHRQCGHTRDQVRAMEYCALEDRAWRSQSSQYYRSPWVGRSDDRRAIAYCGRHQRRAGPVSSLMCVCGHSARSENGIVAHEKKFAARYGKWYARRAKLMQRWRQEDAQVPEGPSDVPAPVGE